MKLFGNSNMWDWMKKKSYSTGKLNASAEKSPARRLFVPHMFLACLANVCSRLDSPLATIVRNKLICDLMTTA